MKGIDVSKHQGKIDWQKVKAAGVEFAIVRAGYGMYENQVDPQFAANMEGAISAGIPVGVYWYSYAETPGQAKKEAETCLKIIGPYREKLSLPVFFDQEYEPGIKAQSKEIRTEMCRAFLEAVQSAGYRPGLYCSYDWYKNWVDSAKLAAHPVWIAHYDTPKCGYAGDNLVCWQYTSKGSVDGISGNVDMDEGYGGLLATNKSGWVQASSAWYWYEDGAPVKNVWRKSDGWWYRLGPDGKMLTGLIEVDGKGYYLNQSRATVGGVYVPQGACIITDGSGAILA